MRRWASRAVLFFLLLLLAGAWYITNPARISRLSAALLSRVLGGNVSVCNGRLSPAGTLLLSGVEVRADGASAGDAPIFTAAQIEARFDWFSLLSGQLSATQLVATTPVFQPVEDPASGRWNYERLRPDFGATSGAIRGVSLPVIVLRDAHVRFGEISQGHIVQTAETVIDGEMTPDSAFASTYHFRFVQTAASSSPPAPGPAPPRLRHRARPGGARGRGASRHLG